MGLSGFHPFSLIGVASATLCLGGPAGPHVQAAKSQADAATSCIRLTVDTPLPFTPPNTCTRPADPDLFGDLVDLQPLGFPGIPLFP